MNRMSKKNRELPYMVEISLDSATRKQIREFTTKKAVDSGGEEGINVYYQFGFTNVSHAKRFAERALEHSGFECRMARVFRKKIERHVEYKLVK